MTSKRSPLGKSPSSEVRRERRDRSFRATQGPQRDRPGAPPAQESATPGDRLLTVGDVCGLIQVASTFVYRHAAELGGIKVGSHLRFRLRDVEAWLDSQRMADVSECRTPVDNGLVRNRVTTRRKRR